MIESHQEYILLIGRDKSILFLVLFHGPYIRW